MSEQNKKFLFYVVYKHSPAERLGMTEKDVRYALSARYLPKTVDRKIEKLKLGYEVRCPYYKFNAEMVK